MKKLQLFLLVSVLLISSQVFSQNLSDYISETIGDTLVIKDFNDLGEQNSLYLVITLDTVNVPAGRVYMLKADGYYPLVNNPATLRPTVIVGEDPTILVNNKAVAAPPVICGAAWEGGSNTGAIFVKHNFTIKNCNIIPANANKGLGWNFFDVQTGGIKLTFQNCLFERTRWVFTASGAQNVSWFIKDCYFVNMNGQPCRRNGGVLDCFNKEDTLWVENNTHVMAQGFMYKFRANTFNKVVFNHNTFINISNLVFLDLGSQKDFTITNNIFVNCNVQPYGPKNADVGEEDKEKLPIGLVNLIADTSIHVDRKFTVKNNVIYWSPALADVVDIVNQNKPQNSDEWVSQMITMNSRTKAMFDDDVNYPYLVEENWIEELPDFTDPKDLLTTQVTNLKTFSISTVDTNSTAVMPDWRLVLIGDDYYTYSDWPIPVDLSYSKASLKTGGTDGLPLGDLNWFPELKPSAIAPANTKPEKFALRQNFPNPFNPTTTINFTLPEPGNVTLKVYNMLGQEVATLINNEFRGANGNHSVLFDGSRLSSGVYFYTITYGNKTISKKMVLMK
ncbi:MAG TPA: T9SS type A sorting domain-containing protein [Candidatus Marinimicrobia bacterium]|nr:T9SS type A sorting domain-containing protein [Candidatus Neomarinimicrobiota bacterium]HRS52105.1 T9SS type A sorting domain-containing protein [Candidatus Neomarinimicrobiota bacterium]HRU92840.1 T9SS type A sorting domain-containing protein [Candidatus Neomarinimicrobiota bacterium]